MIGRFTTKCDICGKAKGRHHANHDNCAKIRKQMGGNRKKSKAPKKIINIDNYVKHNLLHLDREELY